MQKQTQGLSDTMVRLARDLQGQPDQTHTLEHVISAVTELVPAAEAVGISLARRGGGVETPAANGPLATRSDELQQAYGEGPCLDAIWAEPLVVVPDLAAEERWPRWAPQIVEELGVHSMMCVRLFTRDDLLGAVNMFSSRQRAFSAEDRDQVQVAAAHGAVAMAAAARIDNLELAMSTRTTISEAVGLVMCRYELTDSAAFQLLKRLSNEQNRKLAEIALDLVQAHNDEARASRHAP